MGLNENDIRTPSPDKKKILLTSNSVFNNAEVMFVEYHDVVRSPYFLFLYAIKDSPELNKLFDLSMINSVTMDEAYEWYFTRRYINPFKALPINNNFMYSNFKTQEEVLNWLDKFFFELYDKQKLNYDNFGLELKFTYTLKRAASQRKLIKNIIIYSERYDELIEKDIESYLGQNIKYRYGDFAKALEDISKDATYVFSDINKINKLIELKRLNYSSILISDMYGYNYRNGEPIVDINKLMAEYIFKIDFFDNIGLYINEDDNNMEIEHDVNE